MEKQKILEQREHRLKRKKIRPPVILRRLEKIADLNVIKINDQPVLASELDGDQAFYVVPKPSAIGLPRFELYQRRPG